MRGVEKALRLGQAADELGTTRYILQKLCELGSIEGERTPGGHWRIPWGEVERLKTEGVPTLPALISAEDEPFVSPELDGNTEDLQAESPDVIRAEDETKIVRSRLEKRRIEKDLELTEDFFREREREQAKEEATERNHAAALQAKHYRQEQIHRWLEFSLGPLCLPAQHPAEAELAVHRSVHGLLCDPSFDLDQPEEITKRLVIAAAKKAYAPWASKQDRKAAKQEAMLCLPWQVRHDHKYTPLNQRGEEAIDRAFVQLPNDADREQTHKAAMAAIQPTIAEFNHLAECERVCEILPYSLGLSEATSAELDQAAEAARNAVFALPIGATRKQMEDAKRAAIAPLLSTLDKRKKAAELRRQAEQRVSWRIGDVSDYLRKLERDDEIEFDDGWERLATVNKFEQRIRPILLKKVLRDPTVSDDQIKRWVEQLVERYWDEIFPEDGE